jgi:hypothetical protein
MQQNGITTKNNASSSGRLKILILNTPAGLKYQWVRQVANMSQAPNITTMRAIVYPSALRLRYNLSGGQKLKIKGAATAKHSTIIYCDIVPLFYRQYASVSTKLSNKPCLQTSHASGAYGLFDTVLYTVLAFMACLIPRIARDISTLRQSTEKYEGLILWRLVVK